MAGPEGIPSASGTQQYSSRPTGLGNHHVYEQQVPQNIGFVPADGFAQSPAGAPQPVTADANKLQEPGAKNGAIARGFKGLWNRIQAPIFKEPVNNKDFFSGAKKIVNAVWTHKPMWAAAAVGGGVATGIVFAVIYKAALIGAVGAFFSSHVGWAVAAGVGGLLLVGAIVTLYNWSQHKQHKAKLEAHAKYEAHVGSQQNTIDKLQAQVNGLVEARSSDAVFQQGRDAGRVEGMQYLIDKAQQAPTPAGAPAPTVAETPVVPVVAEVVTPTPVPTEIALEGPAPDGNPFSPRTKAKRESLDELFQRLNPQIYGV